MQKMPTWANFASRLIYSAAQAIMIIHRPKIARIWLWFWSSTCVSPLNYVICNT